MTDDGSVDGIPILEDPETRFCAAIGELELAITEKPDDHEDFTTILDDIQLFQILGYVYGNSTAEGNLGVVGGAISVVDMAGDRLILLQDPRLQPPGTKPIEFPACGITYKAPATSLPGVDHESFGAMAAVLFQTRREATSLSKKPAEFLIELQLHEKARNLPPAWAEHRSLLLGFNSETKRHPYRSLIHCPVGEVAFFTYAYHWLLRIEKVSGGTGCHVIADRCHLDDESWETLWPDQPAIRDWITKELFGLKPRRPKSLDTMVDDIWAAADKSVRVVQEALHRAPNNLVGELQIVGILPASDDRAFSGSAAYGPDVLTELLAYAIADATLSRESKDCPGDASQLTNSQKVLSEVKSQLGSCSPSTAPQQLEDPQIKRALRRVALHMVYRCRSSVLPDGKLADGIVTSDALLQVSRFPLVPYFLMGVAARSVFEHVVLPLRATSWDPPEVRHCGEELTIPNIAYGLLTVAPFGKGDPKARAIADVQRFQKLRQLVAVLARPAINRGYYGSIFKLANIRKGIERGRKKEAHAISGMFAHEIKHLCFALESRWLEELPSWLIDSRSDSEKSERSATNWRLVRTPEVLQSTARLLRLWALVDDPEYLLGTKPETLRSLVSACWDLARDVAIPMACKSFVVNKKQERPKLEAMMDKIRALWSSAGFFTVETDPDIPAPESWPSKTRRSWVAVARILVSILGNAIRHGDPAQPMKFSARVADGEMLSLALQNKRRARGQDQTLDSIAESLPTVMLDGREHRGQAVLEDLVSGLKGARLIPPNPNEVDYRVAVEIPTKLLRA